jgi:hypothetical protein
MVDSQQAERFAKRTAGSGRPPVRDGTATARPRFQAIKMLRL